MANPEHVEILKQGADNWNKWRKNNPKIRPDLSGVTIRANLRGFDLTEADLKHSNLSGCDLFHIRLQKADLQSVNLRGAFLSTANLREAKLQNADLVQADLSSADMSGAILVKAVLSEANLINAKLRGAVLCGADLSFCNLVGTELYGADLSGCRVFGISAWSVFTDETTTQLGIIITQAGYPPITVDNLEVAQFVYLLLHNEKLRGVIDTLTTKSVLILGRFTAERIAVLDAIREELRKRGYVPILFDFEKPASRDLTETISTLAHLSRFIIADITDAKSIPQELQAIVPNLPSVAIQPIILASQREYAMFEHFRGYRSVLELYPYDTPENLIASLGEKVIDPAEEKVNELRPKVL